MTAVSPSAPHSLEESSAVEDLGSGRFRCVLSSEWWGPLAPHGGYIAALLLRACVASDGGSLEPVHLSVRFVRRATPGEAEIIVRDIGGGRHHRFIEAVLMSGSEVVASASAVLGSERSSLSLTAPTPPSVPDVERCSNWIDPGWGCSVLQRYETRPTSEVELFAGGTDASTMCWLRLVDEHALDPFALAVLADAWIPPIFLVLSSPATAAPTLEYSIWFAEGASRRPGDWVLGSFRVDNARRGYVIENGELWSRSGELLAKCQQVAVVVD